MYFKILFLSIVFCFNPWRYNLFGQNIISEKSIKDFALLNVDGKYLGTKDFKNARGFIIIFTCNHCPFAKLYTKRINELQKKYSKHQIYLLAINSMDSLVFEDEGWTTMKARAIQEKYKFPYLQDPEQVVAKLFNAEFTPSAYVLWKVNNEWVVKYRGAIDDNGENPKIATPYISNTISELLGNKKVTNPETFAMGCRIYYKKT